MRVSYIKKQAISNIKFLKYIVTIKKVLMLKKHKNNLTIMSGLANFISNVVWRRFCSGHRGW